MTEVSVRRPRMSVVMPNYNHGHLIEQALVAISRQTMLPFEVVVVDDGSTDDSVTRLQSLAADMPWLKIHRHSENRGVNVAANTGLEVVSGDFVLGLRGRRSAERRDGRARIRRRRRLPANGHRILGPCGDERRRRNHARGSARSAARQSIFFR